MPKSRAGILSGLLAVVIHGAAAAQAMPACLEHGVRTVAALGTRLAELAGARTPAARCELAQLRLLTGDIEHAESLLRGVLREQPHNVDAMVALARVYALDERDADAVAVLDAARGHPATAAAPHVGVQWAEHVAKRRDPAEALPLFAVVVREHPTHVPALLGMASVHLPPL